MARSEVLKSTIRSSIEQLLRFETFAHEQCMQEVPLSELTSGLAVIVPLYGKVFDTIVYLPSDERAKFNKDLDVFTEKYFELKCLFEDTIDERFSRPRAETEGGLESIVLRRQTKTSTWRMRRFLTRLL
jgi:hypothetical protein